MNFYPIFRIGYLHLSWYLQYQQMMIWPARPNIWRLLAWYSDLLFPCPLSCRMLFLLSTVLYPLSSDLLYAWPLTWCFLVRWPGLCQSSDLLFAYRLTCCIRSLTCCIFVLWHLVFLCPTASRSSDLLYPSSLDLLYPLSSDLLFPCNLTYCIPSSLLNPHLQSCCIPALWPTLSLVLWPIVFPLP